jgi:hypothetical protein
MSKMYKIAAKQKLRFDSTRGLIATEDLFNLPLEELDIIARTYSKKTKESKEESFIKPVKTDTTSVFKLSLDIVKDVIADKIAARDIAQKAAETKLKKAKILDIMADKENDELKGKSLDDLKEMLDELS